MKDLIENAFLSFKFFRIRAATFREEMPTPVNQIHTNWHIAVAWVDYKKPVTNTF